MINIFKKLGQLLCGTNDMEEIHVSPGKHPEPTLRRFAYLKGKGVRCRLFNLNSPSGHGVTTGMISLRIRRNDLSKANELLRDFRD